MDWLAHYCSFSVIYAVICSCTVCQVVSWPFGLVYCSFCCCWQGRRKLLTYGAQCHDVQVVLALIGVTSVTWAWCRDFLLTRCRSNVSSGIVAKLCFPAPSAWTNSACNTGSWAWHLWRGMAILGMLAKLGSQSVDKLQETLSYREVPQGLGQFESCSCDLCGLVCKYPL